jgi:predicted RNA-binding Zn-ribbon protein involved in translation (DUF1610 family)
MRCSKAIIPQSDLIPHTPCPICGRQMWLALIAPLGPGREKRTFECPKCNHEESFTVKYG